MTNFIQVMSLNGQYELRLPIHRIARYWRDIDKGSATILMDDGNLYEVLESAHAVDQLITKAGCIVTYWGSNIRGNNEAKVTTL